MSSLFKGMGYLVSTFSVVLLGVVAWQGASENRLLMLCLVAGMATSVGGMTLRWISIASTRRTRSDWLSEVRAGDRD